jgi:hypothetical protein
MDRSDRFSHSESDDDQIVVNTPSDFTLSDVDQANRRIEMLEEKLLEARGQLADTR